MARPVKQTVNYFPHMTQHGGTMFILENKFGNDGYAFWFKLLEFIGSTEGHYLDCRNPSTWELLVAKTRVSEDIAIGILDTLARLNAIDAELWAEFKVIWVENFVDGVRDAYQRRTEHLPTKEGLCRQLQGLCKQKPDSKGVSDDINWERERERDSKGKEIEKKEKKEHPGAVAPSVSDKKIEKEKYGEFQNVFLAPDEYRKLVGRMGSEAEVKKRIEDLSGHIQAKSRKYKDHYATVLNWYRRDNPDHGRICNKDSPAPSGSSASYIHPDVRLMHNPATPEIKKYVCPNCKAVMR